MRNSIYRCIVVLIVSLFPKTVNCQNAWYYQWGLLSDNMIDYFIGEASGERAYNHIIELSEYNRQRNASEFSGTLMESEYVTGKLKEYGLSGIDIERFGKTSSWHGVIGTLWEISPHYEKIADLADLPFLVIPGSANTDVEAELVFIGDASSSELDKMDLKGRVVLTSARPGSSFGFPAPAAGR